MAASAITLAFEADVEFDGTFSEDLTSRMTQATGGFTIHRGMNEDGLYQTSQVSFSLRNNDGRFTPDQGDLNGKWILGVPLRIVATHAATPYTLWTGYLINSTNDWQAGKAAGDVWGTVRCVAQDISHFLQRYNAVNILSSQSRRTDQGISAALTEVGLTSADWDLDTGQLTMPFHWGRNFNCLRHCVDVSLSEMGGLLYILKNGKVKFEARNSRLGISSVDHTWGDGTNIVPSRAILDRRTLDRVSRVQVQATVFQVDQLELEAVHFQRGSRNEPADSIALTAGEIWEAEVDYHSSVVSLTAPVAGEDYMANDNQDGTGTDRTSDLTVTVTDLGGAARVRFENTHSGTIYVTMFRLRATMATVLGDAPKFIASKSIPNDPSTLEFSMVLPYASDTSQLVRDYAYQLLRTHRYQNPRLHLTFNLERHDDIVASLLSAEIGDLVYYKDTAGGLTGGANQDDHWYIESIRLGFTPAQAINQVQVMLLPAYAFRDLDDILYDHFTRADNTSDLGQALSADFWLNDTGFNIGTTTDNKADADTGRQVCWGEINGADMVVEVDVKMGTGNRTCGVSFRVQDASNYLVVNCANAGSGTVNLAEVVAGGATAGLASAASQGFTSGDTVELRVIAQGDRIRVWADHKLVIDHTTTRFNTETKAGLFHENIAGTTPEYDDFYAQALV